MARVITAHLVRHGCHTCKFSLQVAYSGAVTGDARKPTCPGCRRPLAYEFLTTIPVHLQGTPEEPCGSSAS